MRNLELPGRSPVHAAKAMAATSHSLATLAAIDTLRAGGNAIDAAVAACATQCVVEPESTSIGGDCFALISLKGSPEVLAYNGSGRAPGALTAEYLLNAGIEKITQTMPHAVTIPGAVEAWATLVADHGRLPLAKVLEPATRYAREGFPVYSRVSVDFAAQEDLLRRDPTAMRTYMPGGKPPRVGDIIRQPELADTLQRIAEQGPAGFYTGPVAKDMVARLRELGGVHTEDDFAAHKGDYVTPIRTNYRGYDVLECPPNGQGIVALIMLNILAGYDLASMGPMSVDRMHLLMEAARLAYNDRNAFVADPAFGEVPVEALLSEAHADDLRALIRMDRTLPGLPTPSLPKHSDTVYLSVVDEERNAVSLICSVFDNFGSGIVSPKTGVLLQNRGCGFVVKPGHPNCVAPNKRPMHTIIPGMVLKNGRCHMPFGVMGGYYQAIGHANLLTNVFDFGMDLQEALDMPRMSTTASGDVEVESGVPTAVAEGLRKLGHTLVKPKKPIGGGQAIEIDWERGILTAGSEPRKDGCALGY